MYRPTFKTSLLTRRQVDVLAMANSVVMTRNVTANLLVICVLIKTAQIQNNTFKLIFMLSLSDLMMGLFVQNLYAAVLYIKKMHTNGYSGVVAVFIVHLSIYVYNCNNRY